MRRPEIIILAHILWSLIHILCQILIERWVFRSSWKFSQFNTIYSSRDMETFEISSYKAHKKKNIFWALVIVWGKCISYNIYSKFILVVILRSQPTLHDRRFTRDGQSCNLVFIKSQNTKKLYLFRALPVVWGVCITQITQFKLCLTVILRGKPVFNDQHFMSVSFGFWAILDQFCPKKVILSTFESDQQVNP